VSAELYEVDLAFTIAHPLMQCRPTSIYTKFPFHPHSVRCQLLTPLIHQHYSVSAVLVEVPPLIACWLYIILSNE